MTDKPRRISASELIDSVIDEGSYVSWDTPPDRTGISDEYAEQLEAAEQKSGVDESVITGEALIKGRRVAMAACEFRFLAGSIGIAARSEERRVGKECGSTCTPYRDA